jgi:hypothetical protein
MSWRGSPFTVGRTYRVRRDFTAHAVSFAAGEVLVYRGDVYSRYDGFTGYSFQKAGTEQFRSWEVFDDEDVEIWRELFEEVHETNAR